MTTDGSIRDEEAPLIYAERARDRLQQTPFPWFQFSILFTLQTAVFLTFLITYPFIPDVCPSLQPFASITLPQLIRNSGIAKEEKDVGYYAGFMVRVVVPVYLVSE